MTIKTKVTNTPTDLPEHATVPTEARTTPPACAYDEGQLLTGSKNVTAIAKAANTDGLIASAKTRNESDAEFALLLNDMDEFIDRIKKWVNLLLPWLAQFETFAHEHGPLKLESILANYNTLQVALQETREELVSVVDKFKPFNGREENYPEAAEAFVVALQSIQEKWHLLASNAIAIGSNCLEMAQVNTKMASSTFKLD